MSTLRPPRGEDGGYGPAAPFLFNACTIWRDSVMDVRVYRINVHGRRTQRQSEARSQRRSRRTAGDHGLRPVAGIAAVHHRGV
ncbi:hypothetical protein SPI_05057 [Niveomyces insectorum RCEF 264]|uniref:Uncharacterized protein n=1 Tax=Niveomyces insectorum RCEF 264 TaxID=1081102 RepID=A0A167TWU3_9HYPO|nr:hypothetical protein SPI_05057 [Niveomyces insectorum RCEF 264]